MGLNLDYVLHDTKKWSAKGLVTLPTIHLINTKNMLIWYRFEGWVYPNERDERNKLLGNFLPWLASQKGAND